ncbi:response regulator [Schaedlerella arabinosiphila]|jgi:two-component system response regulator YesN|uniref:Stage 0 sporulation protein A homolog n=1 Tax=Schaedlerella arabinosiphila TaxID=2044587 RepID=A0A3R8JQL8_9FIRM|nr:response regulator [Schaedlerella arabinosiphila]RRK33593.1 response regulator [Schaedlerella arabinosiphila]
MHSVLIIEDEILARIGLHQLINWEKHEFSLLPDAADGEAALDLIRRHRPDILLLDLNIPKIDGLQILRHLKEEGMGCKVIVISCNEEFDMVKEAMKLGAYDYLRKLNLSSDELLGILKKCRQELRAGSDRDEKLSSFAFHEIRYDEIMNPNGKDLFLNVGTYRTAMCILPPAGETAKKWSEEHSAYTAAEVSKKWFGERSVEYMQVIRGPQICCFLFERRFSGAFFLQLHQELTNRLHGSVYFGIHETVMGNADAVNRAIILAEQVSVIRYYDVAQTVHYFPEKIALREHSPRGTQQMLAGLRESVETFSGKDSGDMIRQILSAIRTDPYTHINVLRRIFMDMLGIYSMTAQKLNGTIEEVRVRDDNCHYQKLMMMNSLNLIERWFLEFQDIFYSRFFVAYKCSRSDLLKSIFSYIDRHLTTQVHLSEAAGEIGVSNAYLSTVFKKEMGVNFIEYVNQKKVDLAKQMLDEGKLVYEVSDVLGFENCTYFSKVFKKYEGISPDGYKRKE